MNDMPTFDLIIIGGGPAGVTAALRGRELGASVALIERGAMGGTCTNDGCVPTRVLARAARLMINAGQYAGYGMPVPRPELDFRQLLARTQAIVYEIHEKKQLSAHLEASGAQVYAEVGEARFVDPHTVALPDGRRFRAGRFILCRGRPRPTVGFFRRGAGPDPQRHLAPAGLPRSVAVVGGAATGCQLAAIFIAFGSRVSVLDLAPHILTAEDSLVSQAMTDAFERRGIDLVAGIDGVERIERAGKELALVYKLGGGTVTVVAEAVVLSTGWLGNLAGLNLAAAGVETDGRYVLADHTAPSAPYIYAAGDIDGRMMLVQSASYEARIAVENALLGGHYRKEYQIVPHGGFTQPEYASVGPTVEQAPRAACRGGCRALCRPGPGRDRWPHRGVLQLIFDRETHRLVAAHVVGEQALEIVHVVAAGIAADMWVEQLAELQIAYPTFTAILGLAARRLVAELGVTPLAPEWRTLGRAPAEWEQRSADHEGAK